MELILDHIYEGHILEVIDEIPDNSIDCMITSPPYWAVRDYRVEHQIWDGDPDCKHKWTKAQKPPTKFGSDKRGHTTGETSKVGQRVAKSGMRSRTSQFCKHCGAWRGTLGLEPSIELYIKHLGDIFEKLQPKLTKHGHLWVNIGDTYYGSGMGHKPGQGGKQAKQVDAEMYAGQSDTRPTLGSELPKKSRCLIPERFALEMQSRLDQDGSFLWVCRQLVIWHKENCLPESTGDRFTVDFEKLYWFVKNTTPYFYTHPDGRMAVTRPKKTKANEGIDWEWWDLKSGKRIKRTLWEGHDYYFKQQFEPVKESSLKRYGQGELKVGGKKYEWPRVGGDKHRHQEWGRKFSGQPVIPRPVRNMRSVWTINPKPFNEAHFAVFPEELVETPIDACCPKWVCTKCGLPRMPVFEVGSVGTPHKRKVEKEGIGGDSFDAGAAHKDGGWNMSEHETLKTHRLVRWTKCKCGAPFRRGIVLDPFLGSGTVAVVARRHGMNWVGIELDKVSIEIAMRRIGEQQSLLSFDFEEAPVEEVSG